MVGVQRYRCRGSARSTGNPQRLESIRTLSSSPLPATTAVVTMTHMLLPHSDIVLGHPGLQGDLQINPNKPLNSQASSPLLQDQVENAERPMTERVLDRRSPVVCAILVKCVLVVE